MQRIKPFDEAWKNRERYWKREKDVLNIPPNNQASNGAHAEERSIYDMDTLPTDDARTIEQSSTDKVQHKVPRLSKVIDHLESSR